MADRLEQLIEMECADALLDSCLLYTSGFARGRDTGTKGQAYSASAGSFDSLT